MDKDQATQKIKNKINEIEYEYWFDKKEFGKVLIVASFAVLAVSVHALYVMDQAYEQAQTSQEDLRTTSNIVQNENFRGSLENMPTGFTAGGMDGEEILVNLEHSVNSLEEVDDLANDLEDTRTTYQWMVLIGILGVVAGITSIYI